MNIKLFIEEKDRSDATLFYIETVKEALSVFSDEEIEYVTHISELKKNDVVFVITLASYFKLFLKNPFQRCIFWFQGITPEEIDYAFRSRLSFLKKGVFCFLERWILKHASFILFVSHAMVEHFYRKYNYTGKNYIVMPCFNKTLQKNSFFYPEKYEKPTFVYAGGVSKWQCLEETINLFSQIKRRLSHATLTLLIKNNEQVKEWLRKYEVDAEIKYVDVQVLEQEIAKYKYGFLLRENLLLNRVATPTKMNSYIANGVIPIFSDVIDDFKTVFKDKEYVISGDVNELDSICNKVIAMEKHMVQGGDILSEYQSVCQDYYNQKLYIERIRESVKGNDRLLH